MSTETVRPFEYVVVYHGSDGTRRHESVADQNAALTRVRELRAEQAYSISIDRRPTQQHGRDLLARALGDGIQPDEQVDMHVDQLLAALLDAGWKAPGQ